MKPYTHRLLGRLVDTSLEARIEYAQDQQARQIPSDPENQTEQLGRKITGLQQEGQLRQSMPAPLHEVETLMRDHSVRQSAAETVLAQINTEAPARAVDGPELIGAGRMGAWLDPTADLAHPDMPEAWRTQLEGYRSTVPADHARVGANLATNPPAWSEALGPGSSRPDRAEEWRTLAADIQAYRHTYNIPGTDTETALAPKDHQELTARATALHKHSDLTNQPSSTAPTTTAERNAPALASSRDVTDIVVT